MKSKCVGAAQHYLEVAIPVGKNISYPALCKLLRDEFKPQEKLAVRLRRFRECKQLPKESVTTFAARVRTLGLAACDSKEEQQTIDSRLLAQFLEGLRSTRVLDYILTKDATTLEDGVRMAREAESNAGLVQVSHTIHMLENQPRSDPRILSWESRQRRNPVISRGTQTKPAQTVRFKQKSISCYYCKNLGHVERDCRNKLRAEGRCFVCHDKGHMAQQCTQKAQTGIVNMTTAAHASQPLLSQYDDSNGNQHTERVRTIAAGAEDEWDEWGPSSRGNVAENEDTPTGGATWEW